MSGPEGLGPRNLDQAVEEARRASRAAADDASKARVAVQAARNIANAAKKTAEEALALNRETLAVAQEALAVAKAARNQADEWSGWDGLSVRRHVENVRQITSDHEELVSGFAEELEAFTSEVAYLKAMVE